jgi:N-acetylglucosaminyldiphosphoundecaprenol N-acetyl-beta-D-mannosaminyltransferase
MPSRVRILGVPVDRLALSDLVGRCAEFLRSGDIHQIVTANPEFILNARRNPAVRAVVRAASLIVPDGVGVLWAARLRGEPLPERVPGVELVTYLCHLAAQEGKSVYLVGGRGVAEAAATRLRAFVPGLRVAAFQWDHRAENPPSELWSELEHIRSSVLLVAYGAPRQELWINRHRERLADAGVRIAMGVGGALDILSGKLPRAPGWLRAAGLEWFWRLVLEPSRVARVLRATVLFPLLVRRER